MLWKIFVIDIINVIIMLLGKAIINTNLKASINPLKETSLVFLNNTPNSNGNAPNVVTTKLKNKHIIITFIKLTK